MKKYKYFLSLTALILLAVGTKPVRAQAFPYLSGLAVNFSDFSYVRTITAGYEYAYFGTTNGITCYNISNNKWELPLTGISGLLGTVILKIQTDRNDEYLWVQTELGKFEYSRTHDFWTQVNEIPPDDGFVHHLSPEPVYFAPQGYNYLSNGVLADFNDHRYPLTDIIDDGWSNLWIGTWGLGAIRADNSNYQMELLNYGLLYKDVSKIAIMDNRVWAGGDLQESLRPGLTVYSPDNNAFDYVLPDYNLLGWMSSVNGFAEGPNDIFAATDNGLLVVGKNSLNAKDLLRLPNRTAVYDIVNCVATRGDSIFVGLTYGVALIYPYGDSISFDHALLLPDLTIYTLENINDALWIGTNRGVYRLDYKSGKLEQLNIWQVSGPTDVYDISAGPNKIWIATGENLVAIDPRTGDVTDYPEVYNYGGVRSVDSQGDIVAAATGDGLLLYFFGKKKYHNYLYTENDGLPSNNIKAVRFDGDYLWIGSDQGLTRFWHRHPGLYH